MKAICELLGPPAAGKSFLGARLSALGHEVVEEQLQRHLAVLGPSPRTPEEALARQVRLVDLVFDAVAHATQANVVVDVGLVSAVAFGMVRLPPALAGDLVSHTLHVTEQIGIRVGAVCLVRADEVVLRKRAAADARSRGALDSNLRLAPEVERIIQAVQVAAPDAVLKLSTDDGVDLANLSAWITARAAEPTDLLAVLADLDTRGRGEVSGDAC